MKVDDCLIQALAERLKQALHETRHIETGQIQIIALDKVRHRAGGQWPELAARVRETSQEFIAKRIGPHDVELPVGDGFIVVYADPTGAAEKSAALQEALDAFYLGHEAEQPGAVREGLALGEAEATMRSTAAGREGG